MPRLSEERERALEAVVDKGGPEEALPHLIALHEALEELKAVRKETSDLQKKIQIIYRNARKLMTKSAYDALLKRVDDDDFGNLYQTIRDHR